MKKVPQNNGKCVLIGQPHFYILIPKVMKSQTLQNFVMLMWHHRTIQNKDHLKVVIKVWRYQTTELLCIRRRQQKLIKSCPYYLQQNTASVTA